MYLLIEGCEYQGGSVRYAAVSLVDVQAWADAHGDRWVDYQEIYRATDGAEPAPIMTRCSRWAGREDGETVTPIGWGPWEMAEGVGRG